jgi:CRP/FNR family transcriptional regulator, cyclic AMP receptor protein
MTTESLLEALRTPLGQALEPDLFDQLRKISKEVEFEKDDIIFRENEDCDEFYLLLSGSVALEIVALGRTICVQTLGPGDELGWSSMLMREGKQFQARAIGPVRALEFQGPALMEACIQNPAFGFGLMRRLLEVVSGRLHSTRMQLLEVFKLSAVR